MTATVYLRFCVPTAAVSEIGRLPKQGPVMVDAATNWKIDSVTMYFIEVVNAEIDRLEDQAARRARLAEMVRNGEAEIGRPSRE